MKVDSDAIKKLAKLLEETGLSEIEVVEGEQAIRVNKGVVMPASYAAAPAPAQAAAAPVAVVPLDATSAASAAGAVKSPMVGTAYLQPEPGAPSFVTKGGTVKAGDTIVIIEAMKVMNPIKADKSGTVVELFVQDGQPVEFGEVLMVIE